MSAYKLTELSLIGHAAHIKKKIILFLIRLKFEYINITFPMVVPKKMYKDEYMYFFYEYLFS